MRPDQSLTPDYFEAMFQGDPDPWGLESRAYEMAKFDRTIAALRGRRYSHGFEVGCAGGSLTLRLSHVCDRLLAIDVSRTALTRAKARCADRSNVVFEQMGFPSSVPDTAAMDLIVLSEVAYYWNDADLALAADWIGTALPPGGDVLLVHWTGNTDYPQTGDGAVEALQDQLGSCIEVVLAEREPEYRIDLWRVR